MVWLFLILILALLLVLLFFFISETLFLKSVFINDDYTITNTLLEYVVMGNNPNGKSYTLTLPPIFGSHYPDQFSSKISDVQTIIIHNISDQTQTIRPSANNYIYKQSESLRLESMKVAVLKTVGNTWFNVL